MSLRYRLIDAAQQDYEEAVLWYAERSVTAAENFVVAIDNTLQTICAHPTRWRNEYKNFYELGVKKYPYTIIYAIEDTDLVVVISIYHQKRNPKKKYRKMK
jgi:plasmid stabilization system protein ParE